MGHCARGRLSLRRLRCLAHAATSQMSPSSRSGARRRTAWLCRAAIMPTGARPSRSVAAPAGTGWGAIRRKNTVLFGFEGRQSGGFRSICCIFLVCIFLCPIGQVFLQQHRVCWCGSVPLQRLVVAIPNFHQQRAAHGDLQQRLGAVACKRVLRRGASLGAPPPPRWTGTGIQATLPLRPVQDRMAARRSRIGSRGSIVHTVMLPPFPSAVFRQSH